MVRLYFYIKGFYQPSTNTLLGPVMWFSAESREQALQNAEALLTTLSSTGNYPHPKNRPDWAQRFFGQVRRTGHGQREDPAFDLGFMSGGNWEIKSYVDFSGGPRSANSIYFHAGSVEEAKILAGQILRRINDLGYISFPDPEDRPDFFETFCTHIKI